MLCGWWGGIRRGERKGRSLEKLEAATGASCMKAAASIEQTLLVTGAMRPNEKEVELAVLQPHRLGSAKSPGNGAPSKRSRVLWLAALAEETLSSSRDVIRHMIGREYVSLVLFLAAAWRGKKLVEVRPFPGVDR